MSGLAIKSMGAASDPIAITELAVSDEMVIVAGTYSGLPIPTLAGGGDVPYGDDTEGFVMAFARSGWTNQSKPVWFSRIASDGGPAQIDALAIDAGKVFVAGSIADGGGIGSAQGCFTSTPLGRGRAFFAQLSEGEGTLDWLHMDGFAATNVPDLSNHFARGTALLPRVGGLLTATSTHGEMLLDCGQGSTDANERPEAFVRLFDFP